MTASPWAAASMPVWWPISPVTSTLANEDYAAWQEDLTAESDISTSGFGLSFVG